MYKHNIDMRVLVNGRPTREYSQQGMTLIEARHGTNYTVKLKNDNGYKVMAILSVDGLDVITGKPAEESNKGYILDPYSSVEIKGYRISDENSAAFIFTGKGKSYVQQTTNDGRNSGVIGVRIFGEKTKPQPINYQLPTQPANYTLPPYQILSSTPHIAVGGVVNTTHTLGGYTTNATAGYTTVTGTSNSSNFITLASTNNASNSCNVSAINANIVSLGATNKNSRAYTFDTPLSYQQFDTGTGWGKKLDDKVKKEYFEKGELLTEIVSYYASREALLSMGVDLSDSPRVTEEDNKPKAFGSKYCQPPTGWVG